MGDFTIIFGIGVALLLYAYQISATTCRIGLIGHDHMSMLCMLLGVQFDDMLDVHAYASNQAWLADCLPRLAMHRCMHFYWYLLYLRRSSIDCTVEILCMKLESNIYSFQHRTQEAPLQCMQVQTQSARGASTTEKLLKVKHFDC